MVSHHGVPDPVVEALHRVVHDHGWTAATDAARLRAMVSDLLGADAHEHRGAVDALAVACDEDVPALLRAAPDHDAPAHPDARAEAAARLVAWGLTAERAEWAVRAWVGVLPAPTAPAPQPPLAPAAQPPTHRPPTSPPDEPPVQEPTRLPAAAARDLTALPPRSALEVTALPPAAPTPELTAHDAGDQGRPRRRPAVVAGVAAASLVALAASGWGVVTLVDDGTTADAPVADAASDAGSDQGSSETDDATTEAVDSPATGRPVAAGRVVAAAAPAGLEPSTAALAARDAGVRVTSLGPVDSVVSDGETRTASPGTSLVAFSLAKGPCQQRPCGGWASLPLRVAVDGRLRSLPGGGPDFVVAVPEGASADLVLPAAGFAQRVSLETGDVGGRAISVLLREDRRTDVGIVKTVRPTASIPVASLDRRTSVGEAELFFFGPDGAHPPRPDQAFLRVDVAYTRPGSADRYRYYPEELAFVAGGRTYRVARDLDPDPVKVDSVFVVPADLRTGTLVVDGTRSAVASDGSTYRLDLPRTTFPVRFG